MCISMKMYKHEYQDEKNENICSIRMNMSINKDHIFCYGRDRSEFTETLCEAFHDTTTGI